MTKPRVILLGILIAQLADTVTFAIAASRFGIGVESNGLAVALYGIAGIAGVLIAKLAAIVIAILLLAVTATRFPRLLIIGGATATSIGLLGFATNSASMIILA